MRLAKERGYFIRCYYMLTADPQINILRVKSRVESGGHDVQEDKILQRYDRALMLLKEVVDVCDIMHIYDNSGSKAFRIFKKRKDSYYYEECEDWHLEDIEALTGLYELEYKKLNK